MNFISMHVPVYGYRITRDFPVACLTFCHNLAAPDPGDLAVAGSGTGFDEAVGSGGGKGNVKPAFDHLTDERLQVLRHYVRLQAQVTAE